MECLEEIKNLDIKEVSETTHISILEIEAIIRKDYSRFNHTKALGFTKIFKREYNIDLTPWLEEFEGECGISDQEEGIFLVSEEKEKVSFKTKLIYIIVAILIIISGILVFSAVSFSTFSEDTQSVENKEIIAEAKRKVQENKTLETQMQEQQTQLESNEPPVEIVDEKEEEKEEEEKTTPVEEKKTEPKTKEIQETKIEVEKPVKEVVERKKVFIKSKQKLWIGVRDNTNNKYSNTTFKGDYSLNPEFNYTLTFGHGFFELINGDEVIKSKRSGIQKYSYKDGEFIKELYQAPKAKTEKQEESAVVPLDKEVEEVN